MAGFSYSKHSLQVSVVYPLDFAESREILHDEQEVIALLLSIFGMMTAQWISSEHALVSMLQYGQIINGIQVEVGCTSSLRAWLKFIFKARKNDILYTRCNCFDIIDIFNGYI